MKIRESELYKRIVDKIKDDKVEKWNFKFRKEEIIERKAYTFAKQIKGKGDINWDVLDDIISDINSRYRNLKKLLKGKDFDLIQIDLEHLLDYSNSSRTLTAEIILKSGDYIIVDEDYFPYDDEWKLSVNRHEIPKFIVEYNIEQDELIELNISENVINT